MIHNNLLKNLKKNQVWRKPRTKFKATQTSDARLKNDYINTKQKKLNKLYFHKLFSWFSKWLRSTDFYLWILRAQFGHIGRRAGVLTPWTPPLDAHLNKRGFCTLFVHCLC